MRARICIIGTIWVFFVLLPLSVRAEHEQKNIDEIMAVKQKEIELAFSDFGKTRAASKLADIEKLNEGAGSSLVEWLDLANMPCCIDKDSDIRKTLEENVNKFTFYSQMICHNYAKILGYYAKKNMRDKAETIYEFIKEAFDNPDFDTCVGEAKAKLGAVPVK